MMVISTEFNVLSMKLSRKQYLHQTQIFWKR